MPILAVGMCLYFNQLFYIIGIDMSGVVVATCMQPTVRSIYSGDRLMTLPRAPPDMLWCGWQSCDRVMCRTVLPVHA